MADHDAESPSDGRPGWLSDNIAADAPTTEEATSLASSGPPVNVAELNASWLKPMQRMTGLLAHILALTALGIVCAWANSLGGVSWKEGEAKLVFNWHPIFMVIAFVFMTMSSLSFRMRGSSANRGITKAMHVSLWSTAALFMVVGLIAVFKSHNDPISGYIANLYSVHSWVGITVLILYALQFLVGSFSFGLKIMNLSPVTKARMMLLHKFFGPFIYTSVAITILLGIQEKEGFVGCSYAVTEPDLFPIQNLGQIPTSCKISHSLGFLVLFTAMCTLFTLHEFQGVAINRRTE